MFAGALDSRECVAVAVVTVGMPEPIIFIVCVFSVYFLLSSAFRNRTGTITQSLLADSLDSAAVAAAAAISYWCATVQGWL